MFKNSLRLAAVLILITALLTGCTGKTAPETVTDQLGRELTIEKIPERIISMSPANTEILFALGAGENVVGVTTYCDYPKQVADIDKVGDAFNPNLEVITALDPDVIFATKGQIVEQLEQLGVPVVVIDPSNLAEVYDAIELIGQVIGRDSEAAKLVSDMQQRAEAVAAKTAALGDDQKPRVYVEVDAGGWTVGPGSFMHDLVELAGGVNIAEGLAAPYAEFSAEQVIYQDPEVIILTYHSEDFTERPGFETVNAVANNRVYEVDGDLVSRPGPRIVDGLEAVFAVLHPELGE